MLVFKKVNPTRRDFGPQDQRYADLRRREEVILNNLGFTRESFNGKRVLDAGCGTGDIALMLADWGAMVDAFDLNEHSIAHAQVTVSKFENRKRCCFRTGSVFVPPFEGAYDFVP